MAKDLLKILTSWLWLNLWLLGVLAGGVRSGVFLLASLTMYWLLGTMALLLVFLIALIALVLAVIWQVVRVYISARRYMGKKMR